MKCREGCEGQRSAMQVCCLTCWLRVAPELKRACWEAENAEEARDAEQAVKCWLAADDKRRAE